MAFMALFLQRALPHHCGSDVHHGTLPTHEAAFHAVCPLCDQALPAYETAAVLALPLVSEVGLALPVKAVPVAPHRLVLQRPARGPPMA